MTAVTDALDQARDRLQDDRKVQVIVGLVVAYTVLYWVPHSPLPNRMPWGVITQGVIFGTSYAMLAMGLILIYRTTRMVNFAYGAMGAMPGAISTALFLVQGWNYWISVILGVAIGIASGAAIEVLVIRRFANSSRLVLTVASIGLAQIIGGIGFVISIMLGMEAFVGDIQTPISWSFDVRPYPVRGDHLLMLVTAVAAMAGLTWFLLRTDAGRAVRAAAENEDRALLLGIPVRRLQTLVWAIAGGLATITFITQAPFKGVVPGVLVSVNALLPGLAAAVIARFKSLPAALGAGLFLGIAEWTILWNVSATSMFDVAFLVVILVTLLTRKVSLTRAEVGEDGWDSAGVLKPIPERLRHLPEVRIPKLVAGWVGAGILIFWPLTMAGSTLVTATFGILWAMVAVSLVVLTGWGGNISLGQFGIVGLSAMVTGNMLMRWNVDLFVALAAGVLAGGLVAVLIGLPALRIRGLYLAVTTIAFAVALDSYFLNPVNFPDYVPQDVIRPVIWKRFPMSSHWVMYYACLVALVLVVLIVRSVRRTRPGRAMIGIRDNERAAEAMALASTRVKLQTFVFSGCIAGLAGGLYVIHQVSIGTGTFHPPMSIDVFAYAVIGGLGSIAGVISGVALFFILDFVLAQHFSGNAVAIIRMLLSGTGLLAILYFLPGGLWQAAQRLRDRYLKLVADRRGIIEPSLVADKRVDDGDDDDDDRPEDETSVISGALS